MEKKIHVYILSLKTSIKRREHALKEMRKLDVSWNFIDSIYIKELTMIPNYDETKARRIVGFKLNDGEIGCFLTHRIAWQNCIDSNITSLILEDDFVFKPEIKEAISIALQHEELWEILRLQAMVEVPFKKIVSHKSFQFVRNLKDPLGTAAYVVKPSSAKKLLEMSECFYEPVDHYFENFRKHKLLAVALKPYVVDTMHDQSTIDSKNENRNLRQPIRGFKKIKRSIYRNIYRLIAWNSAL